MNRHLPLLLIALFFSTFLGAQRSIVVLGSSTAAGGGSSPNDSAWASRLRAFYNKNTSDGADTSLTNLGYPGYVTYHIMPSDYVTPPDRTTWPVDPIRNVTRARELNPDVVIINMPSNDVFIAPNYTMKETMDNFRLMFQFLNAAGITTYITTSQPRNDAPDNLRLMLRQLRDSVLNNFGPFAINFWDDLATTDGLNRLRDDRRADDIHPNNTGHRHLFDRVVARNVFAVNAPLPVKLSFFRAVPQNNNVAVSWRAEGQERGTSYEIQRSANGTDWEAVHTEAATARSSAEYTWLDASPLRGNSHYRLKIIESSKTTYSTVARVTFQGRELVAALWVNGSVLTISLGQSATGRAEAAVLNAAGTVVLQRALILNGGRVQVRLGGLPAGQYFLRLALPGGRAEVHPFYKRN